MNNENKNYPFLSIGLLLSLFVLLGIILVRHHPSLSQKEQPTHPPVFFDEKLFYEGVSRAKKESRPFPYRVYGGIIPHHSFPSFIIAGFFSRLSHQEPTTIILVGPNHFERGSFKALTSLFAWQTPFGKVTPNVSLINRLLERNLVKIDEETLSTEHSIFEIMPYIKFYLPKTSVIPLILSSRITKEEVGVLANELANYLKDVSTVIIAPVDFSHNLTNNKAQERDKITLKIMKDFDYRQLFTLDNRYLDSPASVATLLMVMDKLSATKFDILAHTNSGELQKNDSIETTSYFSIAFY